jgi:hypothetical protein
MVHEPGGDLFRSRLPEIPERLLEQIGTVDFQVERLQKIEASLLLVSQIPWILESDVTGAGKHFLMLGAFITDFLSSDLVHGLGELPDDMELVEDQHCLWRLCPDRLDV